MLLNEVRPNSQILQVWHKIFLTYFPRVVQSASVELTDAEQTWFMPRTVRVTATSDRSVNCAIQQRQRGIQGSVKSIYHIRISSLSPSSFFGPGNGFPLATNVVGGVLIAGVLLLIRFSIP